MPRTQIVCRLADIEDGSARGFSIGEVGASQAVIVVRQGKALHAYRNSCPHTGSPLDWVDHQFLDIEGALIQCAVHDARFLIDTGECILGPCPGESLESLPIRIDGGNIYLLGVA